MRFHQLSILASLSILFLTILAFPQSSLNRLFTHPDIPLLDDSTLTELNFTSLGPNENGPSLGKRRLSVPFVKYAISVDGRNRGNYQNFFQNGFLFLTHGLPAPNTKNGLNPYDIILTVGNPLARPIAGSIRYVTNKYLEKYIHDITAFSGLDFAYVQYRRNTVVVTVDPRFAANNQFSGFNTRTGTSAAVYLLAKGGFSFTLDNNKLSGQILVNGRTYFDISTTGAPYSAGVSGKVCWAGNFGP